MKLVEGNTIIVDGHGWIIDNVFNTNDKGETCIQVRALTKKRFTRARPDGFLGWQTALWVDSNNSDEFDDYARGEYDCLLGHSVLKNQSDDYYNGFADQYAAEQIATHKSEKGVTL